MSVSLTLLRASSEEYKEYKRLLARTRAVERLMKMGHTCERASWEYYINKDRLKGLKKILREQGLVKN